MIATPDQLPGKLIIDDTGGAMVVTGQMKSMIQDSIKELLESMRQQDKVTLSLLSRFFLSLPRSLSLGSRYLSHPPGNIIIEEALLRRRGGEGRG